MTNEQHFTIVAALLTIWHDEPDKDVIFSLTEEFIEDSQRYYEDYEARKAKEAHEAATESSKDEAIDSNSRCGDDIITSNEEDR